MSGLLISPATFCVFLLTYLLHSTLAVVVVGTIAHRLRRKANPELRVLVWKMVLLLPLVTALAVNAFDPPHLGFQFSVASSSPDVPQDVLDETSTGAAARAPESQSVSDRITNEASRGIQFESLGQLDEPFSTTALTATAVPQAEKPDVWRMVVATWLAGVAVCFIGLFIQMWRLRKLRQQALVVTSHDICNSLNHIRRRLQIRGNVDLLQSRDLPGPVTAGVLRPYILVPVDICQLSIAERDALLAHELVHVSRGDAMWNMIIQVIGRVFYFQPLNGLTGQLLRKEMDFVADSQAATVLGERTGLAHCLIRLGDRFASSPRATVPFGLASGMASFRSTLGQRIEALLDVNNDLRLLPYWSRIAALTLMVAGAFLVTTIVPRVHNHGAIHLKSDLCVKEATLGNCLEHGSM